MSRFGKHSLATIEYILRWNHQGVHFEERYLARRVNVWRDVMPPNLMEKLDGLQTGDAAICAYDPGELVWRAGDSAVLQLPLTDFERRTAGSRTITPRVGRFYPQGLLRGAPGVFPSTIVPFRVLDMDRECFVADCNHPLARHPVSLEARLIHVEDKRSETGGRLVHWAEEICNWGPGMQAALPGVPTDFFDDAFFERRDEQDDREFYAEPRIIGHVDAQASVVLKELYSRYLERGMRVLDLMSSMQSHLPAEWDLDVAGVGLNAVELENNKLLSRRMVHDLNCDPAIPGGAAGYDAVVCSLSFEYLIQPVSVLQSVRDALAPGGVVLIGVSNRWFPDKVIAGWTDLHEFERVGCILEGLRRAGFTTGLEAVSVRNEWRPPWDRHYHETGGVSDPIYVVRATNE